MDLTMSDDRYPPLGVLWIVNCELVEVGHK